MKQRLIHTVLLIGLFLSSMLYASDNLFPELAPNPVYLPEEVVGIQMRALSRNNSPYDNAGIELTFRFASPTNRIMTGPLEKFSRLFELIDYAPMLNHKDLEIGSAEIRNDTAFVPVIINTVAGDRAAYLFRLSRQSDEPYTDSWMTDGVSRINLAYTDQAM